MITFLFIYSMTMLAIVVAIWYARHVGWVPQNAKNHANFMRFVIASGWAATITGCYLSLIQ